MFYSVCSRISKLPIAKNIIKSLHRMFSWVLNEKTEKTYIDSKKVADSVYVPPESETKWRRKKGRGSITDLSVIIPFYKTENYAVRCIESVLSQQSKYSFEVILVDDGSPDGCGKILDSYADRENVVVIHQKNAGLSAARNAGINAAHGKYLMFVDSDDILLPWAIDTLMKPTEEYDADIVEGGYHTFNDKRVEKRYPHQSLVSEKGAEMYGYACGKVMRSYLFDEVCFPQGFWYEDTIISYLIYPFAKTTVCVPELVYGYYVNREGITAQTKTSVKAMDTLYVVGLILDHYRQIGRELDPAQKRGTLHQLGTFLFYRTRGFDKNLQETVFVLAAEMAEKYDILSVEVSDFYENELKEALKNRQYKRWKWASILL